MVPDLDLVHQRFETERFSTIRRRGDHHEQVLIAHGQDLRSDTRRHRQDDENDQSGSDTKGDRTGIASLRPREGQIEMEIIILG